MGRVTVLTLLFCYCVSTRTSQSWDRYITDPNYANVRMLTEFGRDFPPIYIHKGNSIFSARITCSLHCTNNQSCLLFNLYPTATHYVCELLPDNICANSTKLSWMPQPGGIIFEKPANGIIKSCYDLKFSSLSSIPCATVQSGCQGTWPYCNNCAINCIDCYNRNIIDNSKCTIWPEGLANYQPVFGACYGRDTYYVYRSVDLSTGELTEDMRMSLEEMRRIYLQKAYKYFQFWFGYSGGLWDGAVYENWVVDEQGRLGNLSFVNYITNNSRYFLPGDILNLNGKSLDTKPFVWVTDDHYGCGSFWLLDSANATYCPGGNISFWGTPRIVAGTLVSTGIKFPNSRPGMLIKHIAIQLTDKLY